jgi:enoyl-CoA hydratase/carnithine racemase
MDSNSLRGDAQWVDAGIHVDVTAPIATLELSGWERPGWPAARAWKALAAAVTGLSRRHDVRCVVLRGVGSRAGDTPERTSPDSYATASALRALRGSRHPIVALVEGACVAWGLEIATCCDLRVCAESARLGAAIDRLRLAGVYDELRPLAQLLGPTAALDAVLAGELLGAERALALGLVNRVAPDVSVVEQTYGLAARIAGGAPLVNRWHKQAVRRLYGETPSAT